MLGTLRFRLTALFLAVVLVFGLVSIGARRAPLPGRHARSSRSRARARGERARRAVRRVGDSVVATRARRRPSSPPRSSSSRPGDELYYVGASLFPGQRFGLDAAPAERARRRRARPRSAGDVRVHAAGREPRAARGRPAGAARSGTEPFGWLDRREAGGRAARAVAHAARPARARARGRRRARRRPLLVALAAAHRARARAHPRDRATSRRAATTSRSPRLAAATRSRSSPSGSAGWSRSSPRPSSSSARS